MSLNADYQKLESGNDVRLIEVDGSSFGLTDVLRFHNYRIPHTEAEIIAAGKDMKVHYDSAFRELYYGDWENQTAEYIETNYKEELRGWVTDWKDLAMPNGEKFSDFYNRVAAGVDRLVEENRGKNVLLVAHNGALSAMFCHLTGAGMDGFWRFDSKQGHYSSVLISKKWTTIESINHPLCLEEE